MRDTEVPTEAFREEEEEEDEQRDQEQEEEAEEQEIGTQQNQENEHQGLVYEQAQPPGAEDQIFVLSGEPIRIHLHKELSKGARISMVKKIRKAGGDPTASEQDSRVIICSEGSLVMKALVRKYEMERYKWIEPPMWVDECIINKRYAHLVHPKRATWIAKRRSPRVEFTDEDKQHIIEYIALRLPFKERGCRTGQAVWKQLVDPIYAIKYPWAKRHTWQSWREQYKKNEVYYDAKIAAAVAAMDDPPIPGGKGQYVPDFTAKNRRKRKRRGIEENDNDEYELNEEEEEEQDEEDEAEEALQNNRAEEVDLQQQEVQQPSFASSRRQPQARLPAASSERVVGDAEPRHQDAPRRKPTSQTQKALESPRKQRRIEKELSPEFNFDMYEDDNFELPDASELVDIITTREIPETGSSQPQVDPSRTSALRDSHRAVVDAPVDTQATLVASVPRTTRAKAVAVAAPTAKMPASIPPPSASYTQPQGRLTRARARSSLQPVQPVQPVAAAPKIPARRDSLVSAKGDEDSDSGESEYDEEANELSMQTGRMIEISSVKGSGKAGTGPAVLSASREKNMEDDIPAVEKPSVDTDATPRPLRKALFSPAGTKLGARKRAYPQPSPLPASSISDSDLDTGKTTGSEESFPVQETHAYEYKGMIRESFTPAKGTKAEEHVNSLKKSRRKGKTRA